MKLLSLKVEHFRCVRKAHVQFKAGLNILHGPNDLGKSSLAHAIRAALLLQTSAKEHEEFISWDGSGEPYVELVFESEPQRIWRVRKTFGSSGKAFLDASRDGVDFNNETRGREVDGRLSEILRWGIAPPGGKGRPKGMPMTFLSTALLAEQERVNAIFEKTLGEDSDESGKKLLVEALQAIAEDPTFRLVLERVQERVDSAFTKTGGKRIGKNSPWVQLREEIRRKEEVQEECLRELHKTAAIEIELQQLRTRQTEARDALDQAENRVASLQQGLEKVARRQEVLDRLKEAQARVAAIEADLRQVADQERVNAERVREVEALSKQAESAQVALVQAQARVQTAKDELARLASKDRVRERQLEQAKLETRRADLRTEESTHQAALGRIREVEAAEEKFRTLELEARTLAKSLPELRTKLEKVTQSVKGGEEQERELRAIGSWLRWNTARTDLDAAIRGVAQVDAWRDEAARQVESATKLEASQPRFPLPTAAQLDTLRRLDQRRRVAAAKLEVGLSVTIRPKRGLRITVQRDEEEATSQELNDAPFQAEAARQLRLEIAGVADIEFAGGAEDARLELEQIERRWTTEAEPVLKRASAKTIDELGTLVADAARRAAEIQEFRRTAAQLEQRMADQPDWSGLLAEREEHLASATKALGDADTSKIEKSARRLGIADVVEVEKRLELLRTKLSVFAKDEKQVAAEMLGAETRHAEKQKSLDAAREERDRAQAQIQGDWKDALQKIHARQQAIQNELKALDAEHQRLEAAGTKGTTAAQALIAKSEQAALESADAHRSALEKLEAAKLRVAAGEGELKMRREAAGKLDEPGAREAIKQTQAELSQHPVPTVPVTPELLAQSQEHAQTARLQLTHIENEIQAKRGALQQVGGDVARQRSEDASKDLELVRKREHETELEYKAWELLRQTLREAEQEEGTHLGRTLADPIARRMSALTGGRYGKLALGPNLETQGIAAAGEARPISLLSVGTREQLSTIFRLTLAEQLQSTVLLDDQLTQTDALRMAWLLDLIRQVAANIQVIVFTCRPDEYLIPAGPPLHSVDLVPIIERLSVS